ncbi:hypothetical protein BH24CHL6_BH24CHL6_10680 [soil metagenome]
MTARLVYGMQSSLDGYIEGPNGDLGWHRLLRFERVVERHEEGQ